MPDNKKTKSPIMKDVDELTEAEIDAQVEESIAAIEGIKQRWSGLRRLTATERRQNVGRSLGALGPPLEVLLGILAPKGKPAPAIAKAFDVLGAQDHGEDPDRFEAELIARRLHRARAEQRVQEALADAARHFGDDVIHVGEMILGPGMLALGLAKSLAKGNTEYATALAPLLDALRSMTKNARKNKRAPS